MVYMITNEHSCIFGAFVAKVECSLALTDVAGNQNYWKRCGQKVNAYKEVWTYQKVIPVVVLGYIVIYKLSRLMDKFND